MTSSIKPELPGLEDVLMTGVHLAAIELAQVHPQGDDFEASVRVWQRYLIQQALKKQQSMTTWERDFYRLTHLLID